MMLTTKFCLNALSPTRKNSSIARSMIFTCSRSGATFKPQNKSFYAKEFTHRPPKGKGAPKEATRASFKPGTVSEGSLKFESLGEDPKNPQTILAKATKV